MIGVAKSKSTVERVMITSGLNDEGTVYRSSWNFDGGAPPDAVPAPAATYFPGLDSGATHLQLVPEVPIPGAPDSFTTLVTNDDTAQCIVLDSFEASWQQAAGVWQPKALFGTLAEEGSDDDLFIWMVSYVSGHYVMDLPLKLSAGKDLISYNIKGPGQRKAVQPVFFKVSWHLEAA